MVDKTKDYIHKKVMINALDNNNGSLVFSDPSFASNKTLPVHRWVPWIAGFSSGFVQDAIDAYMPEKGTLLDPFAGVGTSLIQAMLNGHKSIGFEINPYAAFACKIKSEAYKIDTVELSETISMMEKYYHDKVRSNYSPRFSPPVGFKTRVDFYSEKVLKKVLIICEYINDIPNEKIKNIANLAFASTMVRYSNYSYEPSLGTRAGAGKKNIDDFAVGETIITKLQDMNEDIKWMKNAIRLNTISDTSIINDSFFNYEAHLEPGSIDMIVTSPPYLNNYHYNRNTRPQMYWLGYVNNPKDMKPLEHSNFGNYWQTVRERELMELKFSLPDSDIEKRLSDISKINPEKGTYGGKGWANYATSYFNDCYDFSLGINNLLKPEGTALVVIGNSILQGVMIPTDEYFGQIAASVGLELVNIHTPRSKRVGNSIIQSDVRVGKAKGNQRLYESVVEIRKCP